jgi:hypothetical protein
MWRLGRLNTVSKIFALLLFMFWVQACRAEKECAMNSPDGKISVHFWVSSDKYAHYRVEFSGTAILGESKLGIVREDEDFSKDLTLESISGVEAVKIGYEMMQGKRRRCSYAGNRRIFHLKNSSGAKMDIIFQVSNDGVAFRYYFRNPDGAGPSLLMRKITGRVLRWKNCLATMRAGFFLRCLTMVNTGC